MSKQKNKRKNIYQIGVIIAIVSMLVYGYAAYNAIRMFDKSRGYMDIVIMTAWFILAIYWLRQLAKIPKDED
ncbi:hypothetical protein [Arachidicoccus sp.]|uniref:hypothetical protein n=1 Tax=Arachidicoccus sp. TaxID=1872624 RepID=UPI003D1DA0CE